MASDASPFGPLMPGFEFLQGLVKNAGAAAPGIGQWVAPTLNPEEIQKRIDELKTVQYWLEQNARMIGATIQALEVQRMTLSTLKTMNVQMADLRDALTVRMTPGAAPAPAPAQQKPAFAMPSMAPPAPAPAPKAGATPAPAAVDPMQWWGALTKQFSEVAASALRDTAASAKHLAAGLAHPVAAPGGGSKPAQARDAPAAAAAKKAAARKPPDRAGPA